jgi:hypothetical protein
MGLISDIYEANRERGWDSLGRIYQPVPITTPFRVPIRRPLFPCPACELVFASEAIQSSHLFERHPRDSFFVRVNGAVVSDVVFIDGSLEMIEAVPLGSASVSLQVKTSTGIDARLLAAPGGRLDLMAAANLRPDFAGVMDLVGQIGTLKRRYEIHVRQVPAFDSAAADELVAEAQRPLLDGHAPNVALVRREVDSRSSSSLERRYLEGFAEYLLGAGYELAGDWGVARDRYQEAFGRLRVFPSDLAQTAVGVLEFRMLAAQRLLRRGPNSIFWQAGHFLMGPPNLSGAPATRTAHQNGIWVDEFQEGLLLGIENYYAGRIGEALDVARSLPLRLLNGPGNRRRLTLLTARANVRLSDVQEARRCYLDLEEDPVFGEEARAYLERQ